MKKVLFEYRFFKPTPKHIKPHMETFASETVLMMQILLVVGETILGPESLLVSHTECVRLKNQICDILFLGDRTCNHLHELDGFIEEHNQLYVELFPDGVKQKQHDAFHNPDALRDGNFSWLPCERLLRIPKSMGETCYKSFTKTMTRCDLSNFMKNIEEPTAFETTRFGAIAVVDWPALRGILFMGRTVASAKSGITVEMKHGIMANNDTIIGEMGTAALVVSRSLCT